MTAFAAKMEADEGPGGGHEWRAIRGKRSWCQPIGSGSPNFGSVVMETFGQRTNWVGGWFAGGSPIDPLPLLKQWPQASTE